MADWAEFDLSAFKSSDEANGPHDPIRPFPFPLSPEADESLLGLFARVCAHHLVPKYKRPVTLARIKTLRPETLPVVHEHRSSDLARLLVLPIEEIEKRMYPRISLEGSSTPFINFFGVAIPASYRECRRRRVSPEALARRSYHRAAWELRPFPFDRETMGCLIDRCQNPACGRYLGWRRPHAPELCEHCGADIRGFQAECVAQGDRVPCAFAASLVDPDSGVRAAARHFVPERLADWDNPSLLDLCIRFSYLVKEEVLGGTLQRTVKAFDFRGWDASDLARGARVVLGWPDSFYVLCDRLRSGQAERMGTYGVFKDIGPLKKFRSNERNPPRVQGLLADAIRCYYNSVSDVVMRGPDLHAHGEHAGFLTIRQAAERCSVSPRVIKRLLSMPALEVLRAPNNMRSPIFVKTDQILAWNEERMGLYERQDVIAMTGLPEHALVALAGIDELRLETGPAAVMAGRGTWFRRQETDSFCQRLIGLGPPVSAKLYGCASLTEEVRGTWQVPKPWVTAVKAVLAGTIGVEGVLDLCDVPVNRLLVKVGSVKELLDSKPSDDLHGSDDLALITTAAAAEYLNTNSVMLTGLLNDGVIESVRLPDGRRRPLRASVQEFGRRFILTGEIARTVGTHCRSLWPILRTRFKPYLKIKGGRGVWHRREVEPLLSELRAEVQHRSRCKMQGKSCELQTNGRVVLLESEGADSSAHSVSNSVESDEPHFDTPR